MSETTATPTAARRPDDAAAAAVDGSASVQFPTDFVWGAATSSFQIEGAVAEGGRGESIWDTHCRLPGKIADGTNGDVACDHYHRWRDDVAMMAELGLGSYRFSVAWPRVVPDGDGAINPEGLDFYDRLVDELLAKGIVPNLTLYHWDLPQALQDRGGWLNRDTPYAFARYTEAVLDRLADRVPTWMTLNEPWVTAHLGHTFGLHPPVMNDIQVGLDVSHHLMLAHGLGVERIRAAGNDLRAGTVINFTPLLPETDDPADIEATARRTDIENRWYTDAIAGFGYPEQTAAAIGWDRSVVHDGDMDLISQPIDALGINFYTRRFFSADPDVEPEPRGPITDMGWEIHAPTLGTLLRDLHDRYGFAELVISENGCAMADTRRTADGRVDDQDRIDYYDAHIRQVHAAVADGVPLSGYYAWSLMDNFEWGRGYAKRFGIVEVDYETQERRPKASALWYRELATTGRMPARAERVGR